MTSFALAASVPLPVISKTLRHRTLSTSANTYADLTRLAARAAVDAVAWTLDNADRAILGRPVCRAQRPSHQHPRPNRQLPAYQQARTEEPSPPWPMWPGDHNATTS
ncbi:hypothetical protein GCM10010193_25780 [Kitasatospora atroaurantiaca]|uniref:Phage integrase family protein n=1 Tax=Kitasatospora atroaurantiaca TaxID=285545 RepID=A0A561F0H1_9ACTN|nr:hypothetical protein [Kitasatospora atroaurantiaca]TWE21357.1 hypothetical protein FB465_6537 [Kitasatospora atroaurantiaca]